MKALFRSTMAVAARLLPLAWLMKGKGFPYVLPFYHVVSHTDLPYIDSYRVRTPEQFEKELDFFCRHFQPVSLEELIERPGKNKMHLSFDDGLKECHSLIAPILKKRGIPATFFVSPYFVDNRELFHGFKRAILESKGVELPVRPVFSDSTKLDQLAAANNIRFTDFQPYMTFDQINDLHRQGFLIGAHSLNHPEMWLLDEDEQYRQVVESMQWVNKNFHPERSAFSFPYTDNGLSRALFDRIAQSGEVDYTLGTAGLKHDEFTRHFQRIPVENRFNYNARNVVRFEYLYYFVRSLFGQNVVRHAATDNTKGRLPANNKI